MASKKSYLQWNDEQWEKAYLRYKQKYFEREEYTNGNIQEMYSKIQFKFAYQSTRMIKRNTNTIRDIVVRQDKVSKIQIQNYKETRDNLVQYIKEELNGNENLINRLNSISYRDWKSGTGGAKLFWNILKRNEIEDNTTSYINSLLREGIDRETAKELSSGMRRTFSDFANSP